MGLVTGRRNKGKKLIIIAIISLNRINKGLSKGHSEGSSLEQRQSARIEKRGTFDVRTKNGGGGTEERRAKR